MKSKDWCDTCNQEHGPLYICEHYSEERKEKLKAAQQKWRERLTANADNLEPHELAIMKMFAGME